MKVLIGICLDLSSLWAGSGWKSLTVAGRSNKKELAENQVTVAEGGTVLGFSHHARLESLFTSYKTNINLCIILYLWRNSLKPEINL